MKRLVSFVLAVALALLSFGVQANIVRPPKDFDGDMWNSTLVLYGTLGDVSHALCSIEVIDKIPNGYRLLTAGHCVQLSPEGVQFTVADNVGGPRSNVTLVKAYMKADIDMAIFDYLTPKNYKVMVLGLDSEIQVGEGVVNPNFAVGIGKQLSYGFVSSGLLPPSERCDEDCAGYFLAQVFGAGGSSGSAIISVKTHKVIGLVIWQAPGANIGLGVEPISKFITFMAGPNQPHPAPPDPDEIDVP